MTEMRYIEIDNPANCPNRKYFRNDVTDENFCLCEENRLECPDGSIFPDHCPLKRIIKE